MRAKCINENWIDGYPDPELTKGKVYEVTDTNVQVMGGDCRYALIGDSKVEITRPKHLFIPMVKIARKHRHLTGQSTIKVPNKYDIATAYLKLCSAGIHAVIKKHNRIAVLTVESKKAMEILK